MSAPGSKPALRPSRNEADISASRPVQAWVKGNTEGPAPSPGHFQPIDALGRWDYHWVKPRSGGLWTSTWDPSFGSGWIDWCIGESFAGPAFDVWLLTPDPAAHVYDIDSLDDLAALIRRFPGRGSHQPEYPAWDLVAQEYDGVHLTDKGQWATRLAHPISLYGWDCESTLWFRWTFGAIQHHGTWTAPASACSRGEDCWRCSGSGVHYLSRYDREQESADA